MLGATTATNVLNNSSAISIHTFSELGPDQIPATQILPLGSILNCETLNSIQQYIKFINNQKAFANQLDNAEKQIAILERKIATSSSAVLRECYNKQKEQYENLIERLRIAMSETCEMPSLENLQVYAPSPIDFQQTESHIFPEGNLKSHFKCLIGSHSTAHLESHSHSETDSSDELNPPIYRHAVEVEAKRELKQAVLLQNRVQTGHVRRFDAIQYDKVKLRNILKVMQSNSKALACSYGISTYCGENAIAFITGAELEVSFTGLLLHKREEHFVGSQFTSHGGTNSALVDRSRPSASLEISEEVLLDTNSTFQEQHPPQITPGLDAVAQGVSKVIDEFDKFAQQTTLDPSEGVPTKYTYKILTQSDIERLLAN